MKQLPFLLLLGLGMIVFTTSCTTPRGIIESGRVTPHKHVRGGMGTSLNVPTAFASTVVKTIKDGIEQEANDTLLIDENINNVSDALVAYALDPLTQTADFYIRYGLVNNLDLGYKYSGGVHAFDGQFQFLGPEDFRPIQTNGLLNGSIGLQYSGKKLKMPNFTDEVTSLLGFSMNRKDVVAKMLFSISIGDEPEQVGHVGFGLVYHRAFLEYGFNPDIAIEVPDEVGGGTIELPLDQLPNGKHSYGASGAYLNFRLGYQYVYLYGSMSIYYQNYGTYPLFNGHVYEAEGLTFIPSVGLQFDI